MPGIHPILSEALFDQAVDYVQGYFHDLGKSGRKYYTGAYFDTWAGGGGGSTANELTGEDFVAVSMLSVFVPAEAAAGLQGKVSEIRELLAGLPAGLDFTDLNRSGFDRHLGPGSAAQKLWDVLRSHGDSWGIGPTTASKIMARKRPALIPIYDSEVGPQMGLPNSALQWEKWFQVFQDDPGLGDRLDRIGEKACIPHISRLRIMDVALWRYAKDGHLAPACGKL